MGMGKERSTLIDDEAAGPDGGVAEALKTNRDVAIIVVSLLAVLLVTTLALYHYTDAKDTTSVLGVVLPAITAIGGAAFGISVGTASGAKAGNATAEAAAEATEAKRRQGEQAQEELEELKRTLDSLLASLDRLPSRAGSTTLTIDPNLLFRQATQTYEPLEADFGPPIEFEMADLSTLHQNIGKIEGRLAAIAS